MKIRTAAPAAAVVLALALAGCSSDTGSMAGMDMGSSATSAAAPSAEAGVVLNDADTTFLTDMHPHHAQALEMAALVEGRSTDQAVIELAAQIAGEQQPEMDSMASLLTGAGEPAPSTDGMRMGSMDGMSGMMAAEDLATLETLTGPAFDEAWLTMMTEHHAGAVEMAEAELADGSNPDALALATAILAAQQAEIETMRGLLAQL